MCKKLILAEGGWVMCKRLFLVLLLVWILGLAGSARAAFDPSLVGWWMFDEDSGTTAMDSSGNGPDIPLVNTSWEEGYSGGAVHFHGEGYGTDTAFTFSGNAITLCAWVWHDAFVTNQVERYVTVGPEVAVIRRNSDGRLHFYITVGGAFSHIYVSDVLTEGEWRHVAGTWDGGTQILYLDGVELARLTPTGVLTGGTMVRLSSPDGEPLNGMLDDARIYNRALSQDEILSVMSTEPRTSAAAPSPRDESVVEQRMVQLEWTPGDFAISHKVYFGESFDDVNEALVEPVTRTDASLIVGTTPPYATGLTPGQTYYWRVDEVNDLDPNSPWKGDVWSFRVQPLTAWDPSPADNARYVLLDPELTWEGGMDVLFHTVYFGESFDEVNDAVAGGWMSVAASYDPGPLEMDKTYYWRVDEFATVQGIATTTKGDVWSFTTVPTIAINNPDLAGWWTLDEGAGTTAVDWSGQGNHGALMGDTLWVDGYLGGALEFDGSGDYVDCGSGASLNLTDAVTVAAWVRLAGSTSDQKVAGNQDGSTGGYKLGVYGNLAEFEIRTSANAAFLNRSVTGGTPLQPNVWYHLTGVYSSGEYIRTYVNGVLDRELLTTELLGSSTGTFKLGREPSASSYFWHGGMDDVRVYSKVLTEAEIAEAMRGNPMLAGSPQPGPGATVDVRDATALAWTPGDTALSHNVYFGADRNAVASADPNSVEYQGNQPGTSFPLADLVEFGGGDYYWRIDEVEADGTVHTGGVWKFTVPDYLIVDDFEGYDDADNRIYEIWVDGVVNGTGSYVGYDVANNGTFGETVIVHGGGQSMPIQYDNTVAPGISEADRTFAPAQDWTAEGVTTLVIYFRGAADNAGQLYGKINGTKVSYDGDPADIASTAWIAWEIDLAAAGINAGNVSTLTIGIEGGDTGIVYVDDIWLTKP